MKNILANNIQLNFLPTTSMWLFFLTHCFCLLLGFNFLSFILIILLGLYSIYKCFNGHVSYVLLLLVLGSYHSNFYNVYTLDIFGFKYVYILILCLLILLAIRAKYNSKLLPLFSFILFYFIFLFVLGFFFKYSWSWYINETIAFAIFTFFILLISVSRKEVIFKVLETLALYVLYFNPLMSILSIGFSTGEESILYDEFEKFYFVALVPLLFYKIPNKWGLIVLNITAIVLKASFTYFSSLNVILMITVIALMFIFYKIPLIKKILLILLVTVGTYGVYNLGSKQTKFKLYQAMTAVSEILNGDISAIPRSPKVRVLEFLISFENLKEEGFIFPFVGKGFGSYIDDTKTKYFSKYKITLEDYDYSKEEVKRRKFKKGHGGIPYIPIKMGFLGLCIFSTICLMGLTLIRYKAIYWFAISSPIYVLTTFSYGLKNYIFVGIIIGVFIKLLLNKSK
ncbi:hypothetical protein [Maribacter dokdonensis]|uniref:hypothetical protein n=1 Tax=Maribacter dokdonensis TaxID=320912 RepID=UPI001C0A1BEE|nr:hypothetical protein [Maribacter dokdonensis]MBU2900555.1 hypothetical protein [Maribacter dokdonensis]